MKICGIAVLTLVLCANLQYALFNYGLKDGKLSMSIMAQSTNSNTNGTNSNGTGTDGGLLQHDVITSTSCTVTKVSTTTTGDGSYVTAYATYSGTNIDCEYLGTSCTKGCGNYTSVSVSYSTN